MLSCHTPFTSYCFLYLHSSPCFSDWLAASAGATSSATCTLCLAGSFSAAGLRCWCSRIYCVCVQSWVLLGGRGVLGVLWRRGKGGHTQPHSPISRSIGHAVVCLHTLSLPLFTPLRQPCVTVAADAAT
jgi:hypothetical protein